MILGKIIVLSVTVRMTVYWRIIMGAVYKGSCFCSTVQIELRESRRIWVIAIARRAVLGRAILSMRGQSGGLRQ